MPQNESFSEQRGVHHSAIGDACIERLENAHQSEQLKACILFDDTEVNKEIFRRIQKENEKPSSDFDKSKFEADLHCWATGEAMINEYFKGLLRKVEECMKKHGKVPSKMDIRAHLAYHVRHWPATGDVSKQNLSRKDLAVFLVEKLKVLEEQPRGDHVGEEGGTNEPHMEQDATGPLDEVRKGMRTPFVVDWPKSK
jgi:hypothetical protein